MAQQKGIIQIAGTLGGLNFYIRKGVPVVRKAGGGFSGKNIKNLPSMELVRKNSSEFGACSRVKKELNSALHPFLKNFKDVTLHGRMMRMLLQLKDLDVVSERGKRRVAQGLKKDAGQLLFKQFAFTPEWKGMGVNLQNGHFDLSTYTYALTDFVLDKSFLPKNATHLGIQLGVLVFDFEKLHARLFLSETDYLAPNTLATSLVLHPAQLPMQSGMCLVFVGIHSCQELNGTLHILKEQSYTGLEVAGVFI